MITMKDFISEHDPILRRQADQVVFPLSEEDQQLITSMRDFLVLSQNPTMAEKYQLRAGVGLAAPQLGVSKQIFYIYLTDLDEKGQVQGVLIDQVFINPKIQRHSVKQAALKEGEGCLSVPREVPGLVPRSRRITLSYQDESGQKQEIRLSDYEAIIAQHELDHLKGTLFYDHINHEAPWKVDSQWLMI